MRIEITEKGSDAFYREAVNFAAQYRHILKRHDCKLKDYFKEYKILMIAGAICLVLLILSAVFWGAKPLDFVLIAALFIEVVLCWAFLRSLNKYYKSMVADDRSTVLTFDEKGVEINKGDSQIVKMGWSNVAVVRILKEGLGFVSGDQTGMVISVTGKYQDQILAWLKENQPQVEIC